MATVRYTVIDGQIIAEKRGGVRKFYSHDAEGNTVALYDNTQTKTDTFTYWPNGELRTSTGTTPTKYKFLGAWSCRTQIDGSVKTVESREVDPKDGRFRTVDRLWPYELAYVYANSRPSTFFDPSGYQSVIEWLWYIFNPTDPIFGTPSPPFGLIDPGSTTTGPGICGLRHIAMVNNFNYFSWSWGNCCGLNKKCGPGRSNGTCTDNACERHDHCIGPDYIEGIVKWLPCAKAFCQDLKECYRKNGCASQITHSDECRATWETGVFFCHQAGMDFP